MGYLFARIFGFLLVLPFYLLWLAFRSDFGLLETPKPPEPPPPDPASQPTAVWDRDLDGADGLA